MHASSSQRDFESMNTVTSDPFRDTLLWLGENAGFPVVRLPAKAEALICVAALAAAEEAQAQQRFLIQHRDPANRRSVLTVSAGRGFISSATTARKSELAWQKRV